MKRSGEVFAFRNLFDQSSEMLSDLTWSLPSLLFLSYKTSSMVDF